MQGKSLRLFLVDGSPNGIITAEIMNWTGHVLLAPRSKLPEVLQRSEAHKTGVYFLFGDIKEIGGKRPVYIGESDNVGKRISQHAKNDTKDFFERFCLFTSKDQNLTKAHIRYLENRITLLAKDSNRADVLNNMEPAMGALPESDLADMEFFLEQIRIVLPVLGFDILKEKFVPASRIEVGDRSSTEPVILVSPLLQLELRKSQEGLVASAIENAGEVVVLAGSLARKNPDYAMNQYSGLRETLIRDGSLEVDPTRNEYMMFTRDVPFASPSAAAAVIYGRNANGRTSWVIKNTKKTLKSYQDERAEAAE